MDFKIYTTRVLRAAWRVKDIIARKKAVVNKIT